MLSGPSAGDVLPSGVSLTDSGSLSVAGFEVLGARLYDPGTRGFVSMDPLASELGAGWASNPYAYAGNNPLGLLDPLGLRPMTDADLAAFDRNSDTGLARAWRKSENWLNGKGGWVIGGAAVAAGVAAMFVPGLNVVAAGAISGALMVGGVSLLSQKWDGRGVSLGNVLKDTAIGGAAGLAGGASAKGLSALARATRAPSSSMGQLLRSAAGRTALSGGTSGATSNVLNYQAYSSHHSAGGYAQAAGVGFATSAAAGAGSSWATSRLTAGIKGVPIPVRPGGPRHGLEMPRSEQVISTAADHVGSGAQAAANEMLRPPQDDDLGKKRQPFESSIWGLFTGVQGAAVPLHAQ